MFGSHYDMLSLQVINVKDSVRPRGYVLISLRHFSLNTPFITATIVIGSMLISYICFTVLQIFAHRCVSIHQFRIYFPIAKYLHHINF